MGDNSLPDVHENLANIKQTQTPVSSTKLTGTTPNAFQFPTQGTLTPALTPRVELGLTCTFIALYGILFLMVYIQLWMIWCYKHKRFSYQTVFLYLALTWSGLRATLFSFYFNDCAKVDFLPVPVYWLIFCFPVCLQFIILSLLVLFFIQVVFKTRAKYEPNRFKLPVKVSLSIAVIIFLGTNIACAVTAKKYEDTSKTLPFYLLYIRVAINDTLFIIMGIVLSLCIFKMAKISATSVVLEAKGTTKCQAVVASILTTLLYTSRAVYNLVAVLPVSRERKLPSFGYSWINVTDQADFVRLNVGYAFLSFGIVLFVWEVLPMFIVIILFRVRKPGSSSNLRDLPSHTQNPKASFFDNPRRYDSDEDISGRTTTEPLLNPATINSTYTVINSASPKNSPHETPQGTPRSHRLGYGAVVHSWDRRNSGPVIVGSESNTPR